VLGVSVQVGLDDALELYGFAGPEMQKAPLCLALAGLFCHANLAAIGPVDSAFGSTPERLAQLAHALRFADTSVCQQAGVKVSQLTAAGHTALPENQSRCQA
jgi:hypothetical protein